MKNKDKLVKILENVTESLKSEELLGKLSRKVQNKTGINIEKSKEIVNNISLTIEIIDKSYKDLQKEKENGKTRNEWLRGKVEYALKQYTKDEKEVYIKELKAGLDTVNKEIGVEIFNKNIDFSKPIKSYKYDELNLKTIINDLQKQIKNNTVFGWIIAGNITLKVDTKHKEIQTVKEYFEQKLDSDYDKNFRKAISTATYIAKNRNILPPQLKDKTSDEIAMIVDKGITSSKIAYKLAKGELNSIDALEYTIDRNIAILNSAIIITTAKHNEVLSNRIRGLVSSIFGLIGIVTGTVIGTTISKLASYKMSESISKSMKRVTDVAKSITNSIENRIKSVVSGLISFFGF